MTIEPTFVWAIIMTITLGIVVVILLSLKKKHDQDIRDKENEINEIHHTIEIERLEQLSKIEKERVEQQEQLKVTVIEERKDAIGSSRNTIKGKIGEQMSPLFPEFYSKYEPSDARFLGSPIDYIIFKHMSEYDRKTKAEDVPIDVVLVEVKSAKKTGLSEKEKAVRIAVEEGRVSFDVVRLNIEPQKESEPKEKRDPEELTENEKKRNDRYKKFMEVKFRKWTESDDEYLKTFWNNNSNSQSRFEKIEELSKKFDRSKGAIASRLARYELE